MKIIEIVIYATKNNKEPFTLWLDGLDLNIQATIVTRLHRLQSGNFGDCKRISGGMGVWEFRIHHGPGYRIYWGKRNEDLVILLCGGDKKSQSRDVQKAIKYWLCYKEQL